MRVDSGKLQSQECILSLPPDVVPNGLRIKKSHPVNLLSFAPAYILPIQLPDRNRTRIKRW